MTPAQKFLAVLYTVLQPRKENPFLPKGSFLERAIGTAGRRPFDDLPDTGAVEDLIFKHSQEAYPGLTGVVAGPGGPDDIHHSLRFSFDAAGTPLAVFTASCESRNLLHSEILEFDRLDGFIPSYQHDPDPVQNKKNRQYAAESVRKSRALFCSVSPCAVKMFRDVDAFKVDFRRAMLEAKTSRIRRRDFENLRQEVVSSVPTNVSDTVSQEYAAKAAPAVGPLEEFTDRKMRMNSDINYFMKGMKENTPEARAAFKAERDELVKFESVSLNRELLYLRSVSDRPSLEDYAKFLSSEKPEFDDFDFAFGARHFGYDSDQIRDAWNKLGRMESPVELDFDGISRGVRVADQTMHDDFMLCIGGVEAGVSVEDYISQFAVKPMEHYLHEKKNLDARRCAQEFLMDSVEPENILDSRIVDNSSLEVKFAGRLLERGLSPDSDVLDTLNRDLDAKGYRHLDRHYLQDAYYSALGKRVSKDLELPDSRLSASMKAALTGLNPVVQSLARDMYFGMVANKDSFIGLSEFMRHNGIEVCKDAAGQVDLCASCAKAAEKMYGKGGPDDVSRIASFREKNKEAIDAGKASRPQLFRPEPKPAVKAAVKSNLKMS